MALPLLTTCGLSDPRLPGLTLIKQQSAVDGSFLIASVLGHRLKSDKDARILLVACHHGYSHYSSACLKLAFNLSSARESGQLQVLDVGAEVFRNYPIGPSVDTIRERIEQALASSPKVTVIIDDLTHLLNYGHTESELIDLVEQLMVRRTGSEQSFVIKLNTADLFERLCANLDDMAQTVIQLDQMSSGNFREVNGRLSVSRRPADDGNDLLCVLQPEKSVLYKVNDKNVRIFVPGEIGIKHL
ncbi:elongator complex protein 6 [Malaya genurostris]|uniref:elongator complex protein 6 n=1 Tax=Malaya genurostris TaxID=325434 RepID=UPI0026F3F3AE|nr:elongator complex protein 6 [Malaya genurostris]XP_058455316.1 elongator complex protein 6 [Malaya genurostris]